MCAEVLLREFTELHDALTRGNGAQPEFPPTQSEENRQESAKLRQEKLAKRKADHDNHL